MGGSPGNFRAGQRTPVPLQIIPGFGYEPSLGEIPMIEEESDEEEQDQGQGVDEEVGVGREREGERRPLVGNEDGSAGGWPKRRNTKKEWKKEASSLSCFDSYSEF